MTTERMDLKVLGKVVGTASGSDAFDDAWCYYFYDVQLNPLGQKFVSNFEPGRDLSIDFELGEVFSINRESQHTQHKPDWFVFNV